MIIRLAIVASHPIQYYAPLFRELARRVDLHVFYMHKVTPQDQAGAGFGVGFQWDIDLLEGYDSSFLPNVAARPSLDHFGGIDIPAVGETLRRGKFAALLVTGWHRKGYLQAIISAKQFGLPVMVRGDSQLETQRSWLTRIGKELAYPLLLRTLDAVLYVGARSRAYYEHYHYPRHRLFFSPHCVDNDWFRGRSSEASRAEKRGGIADDARVVLFAGKLQPFKRPLDVIDACALLCAKGRAVHVMVAGSGELDGAMRARAAATGVPLHMLGFQNQTAMPAAYAAADVLVLPSSTSETWGLVVNEALACGTPVVVSEACGCAPDLAADGKAGATFSVGDINALSAALERLLDCPPSRSSIAAKIGTYTLSAAADGIVEAATATKSRPKRMQ